MSTVIVYPRGQLKRADKLALKEAGIVAIEADDPSKVVTVIPAAPLASADDLLMACLSGLTCKSYQDASSVMVEELNRRLKMKEAGKVEDQG